MGVGDVAVVADRVGLLAVADDKRLGVGEDGAACGGIADMSDRAAALQFLQVIDVEHIVHQSHAAVGKEVVVAHHGDACALLAPVLEGVQTKVG